MTKLQVKASKECGACGDQALRARPLKWFCRNEAVFGHDSPFYLGSSIAITKTSGTLTLSAYETKTCGWENVYGLCRKFKFRYLRQFKALEGSKTEFGL